MVNAGATLHVGYSLYVRNFSYFKCILCILNLERAYVNVTVNAKYNLHGCEEQLSQILFTGAVILLGTSELLD